MKRLLLLPLLLVCLTACDDPQGAYRFNRYVGLGLAAAILLGLFLIGLDLGKRAHRSWTHR